MEVTYPRECLSCVRLHEPLRRVQKRNAYHPEADLRAQRGQASSNSGIDTQPRLEAQCDAKGSRRIHKRLVVSWAIWHWQDHFICAETFQSRNHVSLFKKSGCPAKQKPDLRDEAQSYPS